MRVVVQFLRGGRVGRILALGMLCVCVLASAPVHGADNAIPWKEGNTFSRTSVDDDIRSVLRTLLGAEGLSVIFRPAVTGKISFEFKDTSPRSAFEQIIQEYALTAQYNPSTHTVTIGSAVEGQGGSATRRFITLNRVSYESVKEAIANFGLGVDGIAYDPATTTLAISGSEARIKQITDLIKTLEDRPASRVAGAPGEPANVQTKVIRLRFADVGPSVRSFHGRTVTVPGILDTLQAMLGDNGPSLPSGAENDVKSSNPIGQSSVATQPSLAQLLQNSVPPPVQSALAVGREGPAAKAPVRSSGPSVSIDQRTNSVIVRGTPEQITAVEMVVEQLDQPVQMVEIEVIIATAQIGVTNELGLTWRGLTNLNQSGTKGIGLDTGTTGGQATATSGFDAITLLPTPVGAGATTASFVSRVGRGFLETQLQALAQKNKARILSAPHLVTLDNITARITRSADLYVPVSNGALSASGLSQIQTGLTLEITPSIVPASATSKEELLRLSLNATDSAPSTSAGGQITVSSHEVQTDVLVPNGGTLVLGGLFDNTHTEGQTGIPVLKDVPFLGHLFRDDSNSNSLGETIFFITPRIVDDREVSRRDVAQSAEAVAAIAQQRRSLQQASGQLDGAGTSYPRSSVDLEEDQ